MINHSIPMLANKERQKQQLCERLCFQVGGIYFKISFFLSLRLKSLIFSSLINNWKQNMFKKYLILIQSCWRVFNFIKCKIMKKLSLSGERTGFFLLVLFGLVLKEVNCSADNCKTWDNSGYCSQCWPGQTWTRYSCCANTTISCYSCYSNSSRCDYCTSDRYCLTSNYTCLTCNYTLTGCLSCQWQCDTCYSCIPYLYVMSRTSSNCLTCGSVIQYCTNCSSYTACNKCQVNPQVILLFSKCLVCKDIIFQCKTCSNATTCTKCNNYYALNYSGGNTTCSPCSSFMANCLDCSSATNCLKCQLSYVVLSGCSPVVGCTMVVQKQPTSICIKCNTPEFKIMPVNGICLCSVGHLAGGYCTQMVGCINILRNASGDFCTTCNAPLRFQLKNSICVCMQYFERNGSLCQDICGDGMLFSLPCDDGNLIDGDGCSSSCKVENGYLCHGGSNNKKSSCIYKATMSMKLVCINNLGGNRASIVLSITPSISNFAKSNLTDLIVFNSSTNCTMTGYQIVGSELIVLVVFYQNLQDQSVNISLKYDTQYIVSPSSAISFSVAQCTGRPLLYGVSYNQDDENIKIRSVGGLVWLAWLIGSCSHKMIGVETLQTIQLIFIMQAFAARFTPVLYYFTQINCVLNGFQRTFNLQHVNRSLQTYYRLRYSKGYFSNMLVGTILIFSSVSIFFLLFLFEKIYLAKIKKDSFKKLENSTIKVQRLRGLVYNIFIFPAVVGFFFNLFLSLTIRYPQTTLEMAAILFVMISTCLIFFHQSKTMIVTISTLYQISNTDKYVTLYLRNLLLLTFIVCITVSGISPKATYVLAAAELLNSAFLLIYRPYEGFIHNFGIIINQIGVILNIAWIVSMDFFQLTQRNDEIIADIIFGWMILISVWSFVRSVHQKRQSQKLLNKPLESKNVFKRERLENKETIQKVLNRNQSEMNEHFAKQELLHQKQFQNFKGFKNNRLGTHPLILLDQYQQSPFRHIRSKLIQN